MATEQLGGQLLRRGQGAWAGGDGKSGLLYPTTAADTSVELMETRAPVLVLAGICGAWGGCNAPMAALAGGLELVLW